MEYLGYVPNDTSLSKSVMQQKPVSTAYPNSHAAKAFKQITDKLLNIKTEDKQSKKGLSHMFVKLFNKGH
jgi:flagellar biosynthesis protein FlhG